MRAVVQRVSRARVRVDGETVGEIGRGLLALVAISRDDDDAVAAWMAHRIATLRVFEDDAGRFAHALDAVGGEVLAVSQFTLYGDCRRGARPSFDRSAPPEPARALFDRFVEHLESMLPGRVRTGRFGARMQVELVNDGPVTLIVEKEAAR